MPGRKSALAKSLAKFRNRPWNTIGMFGATLGTAALRRATNVMYDLVRNNPGVNPKDLVGPAVYRLRGGADPSSSSSSSSSSAPATQWLTRTFRTGGAPRIRILRPARRVFVRRRVRARYLNPRVVHRLKNKAKIAGTRQELKIRKFKRRLKIRNRLRHKVRRWWRMGKWVLFGNYGATGAELDHESQSLHLSVSTVSDNDGSAQNSGFGGITYPLGTFGVTARTSTAPYYRIMRVTPNVHFNKQTTAPNNGINDSVFVPPQDFTEWDDAAHQVTELDNVGVDANSFLYSHSTSTSVESNTERVRMPPVPIREYKFTSDPTSPYSTVDSSTGQFYLPYYCFWKKVYFRIDYSIKVTWPEAWSMSNLNDMLNRISTGNQMSPDFATLPPNPPFYVRLFVVRQLSETAITPNQFIRACFPLNSPINSGFAKGYRRVLWSLHRAIVVWHKLWMFNGQITPQFQSSENLADGEEGHFVVGVNYRTHNSNSFPDSTPGTSLRTYWPTDHIIGSIRFFLVCGFLAPQFRLKWTATEAANLVTSAAVIEALNPTASVDINMSAYCFPRLMAPNVTYPYLYQSNVVNLRSNSLLSAEKTDTELEKIEKENQVEVTIEEKEEEKSATDEPDEIIGSLPAIPEE